MFMTFFPVFLIFFIYSSCCNVAAMPSTTDSSCAHLDVYGDTNQASPVPGDQLPYCRTDDTVLQCCTLDYLVAKRSATMGQLSDSIQTDLSHVFEPWRESYAKLTDSLSEFSDIFVDNYPFPPSMVNKVKPFIAMVKPLLKAQLLPLKDTSDLTYNFTQFATNLAHELINHFLEAANELTQSQKDCLGPIIRDKLSPTALDQVGQAMKQLQLIYRTLNMTQSYLDQLSLDSIGYTPSDECLDAVLSQNCEQCRRNIPELCENTCTSAVIGCLSPIQEGLRPQIEAVWNITRQLTMLIESHVNHTLRIYQPAILSVLQLPSLASSALSKCQVNLYEVLGLTSRKRRYLGTIALPPSLDAAVQGVLSIDGIMFSFNGDSPPTYCVDTSSRLDCWNGQEVVRNGTLSTFMKLNIDDQRDNPAYSFNTNLLYQQASLLMDPTSDFLDSPEIQSLLPSSVRTPDIIPIPVPTFTIPTTTSTTDSIHTDQYTTSIKPSQTSRPNEGEHGGSRSSSVRMCSSSTVLLFLSWLFVLLLLCMY